ncbi:MAG: hypothetical protein ABH821_05800 [archaeon]
MKKLARNEMEKEKIGWLSITEKSMDKLWSNLKDKKTWSKYK